MSSTTRNAGFLLADNTWMIVPVTLQCDPTKNLAPHWPYQLNYKKEVFIFYKDSRSGRSLYRHESHLSPVIIEKLSYDELLIKISSLESQIKDLISAIK